MELVQPHCLQQVVPHAGAVKLAETWTNYLESASDGVNKEKGTRRSELYKKIPVPVRGQTDVQPLTRLILPCFHLD